ncbi:MULTISPECIES: hypothetical protein [Sulfurimonas]|uniref:hypothetical protein n=1 Tax=Sulfurimonas TaxID=202746 RepID=UPI00126567AD|nr:hypothetical protein [Sulfurimonas indica]
MWDGEKLFLNFLVLICAALYWFTTSHYIPAVLGFLIVFLYFFDETFAFMTLILSVLTLLLMIILLFIDYYYFSKGDDFAQFGFSVLYMGVLYFKSKSIFEAS